MFRAIGFVIALYAITQFLENSFDAFDSAATATFRAIETAAEVTEQHIIEQNH